MSSSEKPVLLATVFSDYICPFCYIGDLRLDRLREYYDLRINWCLVEIHPETPPEGGSVAGLGYASGHWRQMMANLERLAAEEGVRLREHDFTANSHKALLLAEAAKEEGSGIFNKLHRRLFEAFFVEDLNIGDPAVLTGLALDCGVPETTVRRAWQEPRYEEKLRLYLAAAGKYEVRATPTVFFSERHRLNGALPFAAFLDAAHGGYAVQRQDGITARE
jgi:predicted DsbA family dithiol-disulfide isomerase